MLVEEAYDVWIGMIEVVDLSVFSHDIDGTNELVSRCRGDATCDFRFIDMDFDVFGCSEEKDELIEVTDGRDDELVDNHWI